MRQAVEIGVDILTIIDHNAFGNAAAAFEAAAGQNITIIPGMELETKEEVYLLLLFETIGAVQQMEQFVDERRSGRKNDEQKFGVQLIVDANNNFWQ